VPADSELARRRDIDWANLSGHTLIGPNVNDDMWRQFSQLGIHSPRRVQLSNAVLAKRFVEGGQTLALLYRSVALEPEGGQRRIAILRLPDAPTPVPYWMATRSPEGSSPMLRRFVDLLQAHTNSLRD